MERRETLILVTGVAGFIGMHLAKALLKSDRKVLGVDNLNDYYSPDLKRARLAELGRHAGFEFVEADLANAQAVGKLFGQRRPQSVLHMAAQAGVRYSLTNPNAYVQSNVVAFGNVLEGCRNTGVTHLVFASSSSVYGANTRLPYSVQDSVDHPISLYAATKKANELMAHAYAHLYGLPVTGLRFFTVYGPWGRPDMAYFKFTKAIFEGKPIEVYNNGNLRRDFTYIDDVVDGVLRVLEQVPTGDLSCDGVNPDPSISRAPYSIYNLGNHRPVELLHFIDVLERIIGRKAIRTMLPMQPGDVPETYADIESLARATGFSPKTSIEEGLPRFVAWYRNHYAKSFGGDSLA